jgi:hypothetical protein
MEDCLYQVVKKYFIKEEGREEETGNKERKQGTGNKGSDYLCARFLPVLAKSISTKKIISKLIAVVPATFPRK